MGFKKEKSDKKNTAGDKSGTKQRDFKEKKLLWIILLVLVLCLVVITAVLLFSNDKQTYKLPKITEESLYPGQSKIANAKGESIDFPYEIKDCAFTPDRNRYLIKTTDNELYLIKENFDKVLVADQVSNFKISYTGERAFYLTDDNEDEYRQTLYLYDIRKDNSVKIDENVYPDRIALSPSGNYVSYIKNYEGHSDNYLYLAGLGKGSKQIDKDGSYPSAVSDDGKHFYYIDESDVDSAKLYFYNGKESEKIGKDVVSSISYNRDFTEVVFNQKGAGYYYTSSLKDPVQICGERISGFVVSNDSMVNGYSCGAHSFMYHVKTLKGCCFVAREKYEEEKYNEAFYKLNQKGTDCDRICDAEDVLFESADMKQLLVKEDDKLYKVSNLGPSCTKALVASADKEIVFACADKKLSKIYYVTNDGALYYVKSPTKSEKISAKVDGNGNQYKVIYHEDTNKVYFLENQLLFSANKANESRELLRENVKEIRKWGNGVLTCAAGEDSTIIYYYANKDGFNEMFRNKE